MENEDFAEKVLKIGYERYLNVEVYKRRIKTSAETFLIEANKRGEEWGKKVHVFVVGLGLGVWQISALQV